MRIDQPRPRQVAHDLRQKPRWDVHLLRDLAAAEQPIAGLGEGKHRPERVVAALGQIKSHGVMSIARLSYGETLPLVLP